MRFGRWGAAALVGLFVMSLTAPVLAQASGLTMTTGFPGVVVKPGDAPAFKINVAAPVGTDIGFSVTQIPDGWTQVLRGAGMVVSHAQIETGTVDANGVVSDFGTADVQLTVQVPSDAGDGDYTVVLQGTSTAGTASLELTIRVSADVSGGVTLQSGYPALRGSPDTTFTYAVDLLNDTSEEIEFALAAEGPAGWTIDVKPTAQSRAATVTLSAGAKTTLSVDVDPPNDTPAGSYPITVTVTGGNQAAQTQLTTEVTGNFAMTLATADQRLNAAVHAGADSTVALQVTNTGTAELDQVGVGATAPNGWDVTFEPSTIPAIAPGQTVDVTATIKASEQAVAGDYRLTMRAQVPETNDQIELRVSVQTSALWGFVGIGLVVLALGGLGMVFWRLGRR